MLAWAFGVSTIGNQEKTTGRDGRGSARNIAVCVAARHPGFAVAAAFRVGELLALASVGRRLDHC